MIPVPFGNYVRSIPDKPVSAKLADTTDIQVSRNAVYGHSARLGRSEPDLCDLCIFRISKEIADCPPIREPETYKSVRFPISLHDFEFPTANQIHATMLGGILWHARAAHLKSIVIVNVEVNQQICSHEFLVWARPALSAKLCDFTLSLCHQLADQLSRRNLPRERSRLSIEMEAEVLAGQPLLHPEDQSSRREVEIREEARDA